MDIVSPRIGWHASSYSPKMASIRLRLLQPIAFLQGEGLHIELFREGAPPSFYDVVIFSKSICKEAVDIARATKRAGKTVIFDICDNVFAGKGSRKKAGKTARLREMISLADIVVFSTSVLKDQILEAIPDFRASGVIIPDIIEQMTVNEKPGSIVERLQLASLDRFLRRNPGALHCVWFGKCQGNKAGLVHVDNAVAEIEQFAQNHSATLTIIGNRRLRYWSASRRWRIPHTYIPWSMETFAKALAMHDVAIIPVERNGYTIGKTINRPATAIAAGLGVIADSIDAYEELRPFIVLDDWQGGLDHYSRDKITGAERIAAGHRHLEQVYGQEVVGRAWMDLLSKACRTK